MYVYKIYLYIIHISDVFDWRDESEERCVNERHCYVSCSVAEMRDGEGTQVAMVVRCIASLLSPLSPLFSPLLPSQKFKKPCQ